MWKKMQGDKCVNKDEENITDSLTSIKEVRNHGLNNQNRETSNVETRSSIRRKKSENFNVIIAKNEVM